MSIVDFIEFKCPGCKAEMREAVRGGPESHHVFCIEDAPVECLNDLKAVECGSCGELILVHDSPNRVELYRPRKPRFVKHSIIGVTYDRPDYLDEAIRSIETQTDQDYEHLVYSKDAPDSRSVEVMRAAKARRPGKFFFTCPGGAHVDVVGHYWNVLLGFTRGRYITILDDDNRKRPTYLAEMTAPMEAEPTIEAVTCGWSIIDGEGKLTGEDRHLNLRTSMQHLWWDNSIDSNAVVFRRSVLDKIGQFDPNLTTNEDWDFMIRLVRHCGVLHLESSLLEYREHASSRSKRALDLGAHENWRKIRESRFTAEENAAARR